MARHNIVIVSPALADANNGNWQTARRWARLLSVQHNTRITRQWPDDYASADTLMLALHARRSASAIAAWAAQRGSDQLAVVLTGTDLYRDIGHDPQAQHSLVLARTLVVLQERAPQALSLAHRDKTRVIFQSTSARQRLSKTQQRLRVLMVGHLREEKSPTTLMRAAALLRQRPDICIDHIGAPLDAALAAQAQATMAHCPNYRWLGALPHAQTRQRIQRAHLLVHASQMEGGAHVIMEAVRCGTPVLASRVDGNIGMLGERYPGYFEWGNARALALDLQRLRDSPKALAQLLKHCQQRASLFTPEHEQAALLALVRELSGPSREPRPA